MINKYNVVIFLSHNAIRKKTINPAEFFHYENVVVDPDLKEVRNFPPHFWKLVDGEVLPMTPDEQSDRMLFLNEAAKKGIVLSNSVDAIPTAQSIDLISELERKRADKKEKEKIEMENEKRNQILIDTARREHVNFQINNAYKSLEGVIGHRINKLKTECYIVIAGVVILGIISKLFL